MEWKRTQNTLALSNISTSLFFARGQQLMSIRKNRMNVEEFHLLNVEEFHLLNVEEFHLLRTPRPARFLFGFFHLQERVFWLARHPADGPKRMADEPSGMPSALREV